MMNCQLCGENIAQITDIPHSCNPARLRQGWQDRPNWQFPHPQERPPLLLHEQVTEILRKVTGIEQRLAELEALLPATQAHLRDTEKELQRVTEQYNKLRMTTVPPSHIAMVTQDGLAVLSMPSVAEMITATVEARKLRESQLPPDSHEEQEKA